MLDGKAIGWVAGTKEANPESVTLDNVSQAAATSSARVRISKIRHDSGHFFTTDRKFAENLYFVLYLPRERDELLRGELIGDVRNVNSPIYLGVWPVKTLDDLHCKLKLIQRGAPQ